MASIMKTVSELMKGMSIPQWILLVLFLLYFIFPITFPQPVYQAFESIPGMIFVFCFIVYLFLYSHPILGIFALLAAYEFFYHSSASYSPSTSKTAFLEHAAHSETIVEDSIAPSIAEIPMYYEESVPVPVAPSTSMTLEEEMVQEMAPIGHSDTSVYITTQFQPIADSVGSASIYM